MAMFEHLTYSKIWLARQFLRPNSFSTSKKFIRFTSCHFSNWPSQDCIIFFIHEIVKPFFCKSALKIDKKWTEKMAVSRKFYYSFIDRTSCFTSFRKISKNSVHWERNRRGGHKIAFPQKFGCLKKDIYRRSRFIFFNKKSAHLGNFIESEYAKFYVFSKSELEKWIRISLPAELRWPRVFRLIHCWTVKYSRSFIFATVENSHLYVVYRT